LTLQGYFITGITFVLVLGSMVVIHEFGHFIVAKFFGIRVDVFSVGFGKRLFGVKRGDTDYRLSLIPLGGYVKMAGENLDEAITGAPDEFMSKPKWQRFCVAVAGPVMNIITALAIPAAMAMFHHELPAYLFQPALVKAVEPGSPAATAGIKPEDLIVKIGDAENPTWRDVEDFVFVRPEQTVPVTVKRGEEFKIVNVPIQGRDIEGEKLGFAGFKPVDTMILVANVVDGQPAAEAGLKANDRIVGVNGTEVEQNRFGSQKVIDTIRESKDQPVTLNIKRDGVAMDIKATPRESDGAYRLGFNQAMSGVDMIVTKLGPIAALQHSVDTNWRIVKLTKTAIAQIFSGQRKAGETLTGPVGIIKLSGQAAEEGASTVLQLMAVLSLNLGIFNLLPIPVLDGGLIFMLLLEALLGFFGLTLNLRVKEKMMQVGMVMLMLLMGFVIFNDISKMIPGKKAPAPTPQVEQSQPANK
jgi:regulator of sigma E protease